MNTITTDLLDTCANEPIRVPNAIQPFGYFFATTKEGRITHISANVENAFDNFFHAPLDRNLSDFFCIESDINLFSIEEGSRFYIQALLTNGDKSAMDGVVYRSGESYCFEFEPYVATKGEPRYQFFNAFSQLGDLKSLDLLCDEMATQFYELSGFDRVMVYRFDDEFNGVVVSESKKEGVESFLGHHFPADDIPAQARELYVQNLSRIIPDASYKSVDIIPVSSKRFDMTHSVLRSVSPIHCQYLINMEVQASMSLSLIVEGKLWGLIACHALNPVYLPLSKRILLEKTLGVFNSYLEEKVSHAKLQEKLILSTKVNLFLNIFEKVCEDDSLGNSFNKTLDLVKDICLADGACYLDAKNFTATGITPDEENVKEILAAIEIEDEKLFVTQSLCHYVENCSPSAMGMIVFKINSSSYLMWFRQEFVQTLQWAGNPQKLISHDEGKVTISPRKSFETFKHIQRGKSLPWTTPQLDAVGEMEKIIRIIKAKQALEVYQEQKSLLIAQSKMASMGEMIDVVAHQWKQPLNSISLMAAAIEIMSMTGDIESDSLLSYSEKIGKQVKFMNSTLNTFRNFFSTSREKTMFYVDDIIQDVEVLLMAVFQGNDISFKVHSTHQLEVFGFENDLKQVFINIISNAKENFIERDVKERQLDIYIDGNLKEVRIHDNGGGIPHESLQKVFENRFTTKAKQGGTGVGLYLCKIIMTESFNGDISVENVDNGAMFVLKF